MRLLREDHGKIGGVIILKLVVVIVVITIVVTVVTKTKKLAVVAPTSSPRQMEAVVYKVSSQIS